VIVIDVSFISLSYIFENASKIIEKDKNMICLIKPQFETAKKEHNKNGVVNNPKIHFEVIKNVIGYANKFDLHLNELDFSPIKGDKSGNIEYLGLFSFIKNDVNNDQIKNVITDAFLKNK
jgi:23S rRNA (cytidine1920-2'-O)/16S rRNA (cytidine1409-2'-O)-methyltransferase